MSTKHDFFDAFMKLYADLPESRIAVMDLVRTAGYHRNTFYAHFHSVDDLFEQLKNAVADEVLRQASMAFCGHWGKNTEWVPRDFKACLRLLFEREEESRFSELLCEKCRPFVGQKFAGDLSGDEKAIQVEFKLRGAVAGLSYYCCHGSSFDFRYLYSLLHQMVA